MRLKELEKRLREEPDNLGLRVAVAGAMREAGRHDEAVELYRSVAIAYRDQGRSQQAIAVCRSILEIAPGDVPSQVLLAALAPAPMVAGADPRASGQPRARRPSQEETPLPRPVPYHVADPTTASVQKLSAPELEHLIDLPISEGADTRPGSDDGPRPPAGGIARAARRITASLAAEEDLAADLETRERPRIESHEIARIAKPPPTVPFERVDLEPAPEDDVEEERTEPRDLPVRSRSRGGTSSLLMGAFFAPLPVAQRSGVLARFQRKSVAAGATVIRHGESGHPLVLVARGRLDVRAERSDGPPIQVGTVAMGEYIGEAALLARVPAPAHVVAATEADLLLLPPRDFYELAGMYPALWAELKHVAERRTREHDQRLRRR